MITRVTPAAASRADLVGGERPPGDLDERLRAAAGRVAEPLGLAAGEDDRLHLAADPAGRSGRPMPS